MMTMTGRILLNEANKALLILWRYKFNTIAEMVQKCLGFLAIGFLLGQGHLDPARMAWVLPGWMMYFYARIVLFEINQGITDEAATGTLEQLYMSRVSPRVLLLGRLLGILVVATITVFVSVVLLSLLIGIRLSLRWEALPVMVLTLAGLFGCSLMFGGAALIFKRVQALADVAQDLILFTNGTFVAISLLPRWLQDFCLALPTTYGIIVLRRVTLNGESLVALWRDNSLPLLIAHSTLYIVVGWLTFLACERVARRQGSLGQY